MRNMEGYMHGVNLGGWVSQFDKYDHEHFKTFITEDDILEIELQDYARSLLKECVGDQKERREYLYRIFEDEKINEYVRNNQIDDAKVYIDNLIRGLQ